MGWLKKVLLVVFVSLFALPNANIAVAENSGGDIRAVLDQVNQKWRSSFQKIDYDVLREQAYSNIPRPLLAKLAKIKTKDLVRALKAEALDPSSKLSINRGVAENIVRVAVMAKRDRALRGETPIDTEAAIGVSWDKLDQALKSLPSVTPEDLKYGFDFRESLQRARTATTFVDQDVYAVKIASDLWVKDPQQKRRLVAEIYPRGKAELSFYYSMGSEQVLMFLEQYRITAFEIEFLKNHPTFRFVPAEFWEYLRTWRFKGNVRAVPSGTILGFDVPMMQIEADPLSIVLIEMALQAELNRHVTPAIYAGRSRMAVKNTELPLLDGSGRRGPGAVERGNAAVAAGFSVTSTIGAGLLHGAPIGGSAENHMLVGQSENEREGHYTALVNFPASEGYLLIDTYDIHNGARTAVRAGGPDLRGVKVDSELEGKDLPDTLFEVAEYFVRCGAKVGAGPGEIQLMPTNELNEYELANLVHVAAPFHCAMMGGRLMSGPPPGLVMKTVARIDADGTVHPVLKAPNPDKASLAGIKEVYEISTADGMLAGNVSTLRGEAAPANGVALLEEVMHAGKIIKPGPVDNDAWRKRAMEQLGRLPEIYQTIDHDPAKIKKYPRSITPALEAMRQSAIGVNAPDHSLRYGFVPMTGDPFQEEHLRMILAMMDRADLAEVYVVINGDKPPSTPGYDKRPKMSAKARLARAKRICKDHPNIRFLDYEVDGLTNLTFKSLMKFDEDIARGEEIYLMGGTDFLYKTLPGFHNLDYVLERTNILIAERKFPDGKNDVFLQTRSGKLPEPLAGHYVAEDRAGFNWKHLGSGRRLEIGGYSVLSDLSSTKIREFYDTLGLVGFLNDTDPQETFLYRSAIPTKTRTENGSLAAKGSEISLHVMTRVTQRTKTYGKIKSSGSGDAHLEVEPLYRALNDHFFPPLNHPAHGMKDRTGPTGDEYVEEIEAIWPADTQIRIPHHHSEWDGEVPKLVVTPFSWADIDDKIADPNYFIRFEKNGFNSTNVFSNPHYAEYLEKLDPYKVLPHFHIGWCTDWCVGDVVGEELQRGYSSYLVIDGVAGIFPRKTKTVLRWLAKLGARFITSEEYLNLVEKWDSKSATWFDVVNDLEKWHQTSTTQADLLKLIGDGPSDPSTFRPERGQLRRIRCPSGIQSEQSPKKRLDYFLPSIIFSAARTRLPSRLSASKRRAALFKRFAKRTMRDLRIDSGVCANRAARNFSTSMIAKPPSHVLPRIILPSESYLNLAVDHFSHDGRSSVRRVYPQKKCEREIHLSKIRIASGHKPYSSFVKTGQKPSTFVVIRKGMPEPLLRLKSGRLTHRPIGGVTGMGEYGFGNRTTGSGTRANLRRLFLSLSVWVVAGATDANALFCQRHLIRKKEQKVTTFDGHRIPVPWGLNQNQFAHWIDLFRYKFHPSLDAIVISGERTHFSYGYLPTRETPLRLTVIESVGLDEDEHGVLVREVNSIVARFTDQTKIPVRLDVPHDRDLPNLMRTYRDFSQSSKDEREMFLRAEREVYRESPQFSRGNVGPRPGWFRRFVGPSERDLVDRARQLRGTEGVFNKEAVIVLYPHYSDEDTRDRLRDRGYKNVFIVDPADM